MTCTWKQKGARRFVRLTLAVLLAAAAERGRAQPEMRFTCGPSKPAAGVIALTATSRYADAPSSLSTPSFGFDLQPSPSVSTGGACTSDKPFFFSVAVPDGNYQVVLTLGSNAPSTTTVRAESRRLFIAQQHLPAGASQRVVFNVNVRSPEIQGAVAAPSAIAGEAPSASSSSATPPAPSNRVKLKVREIGALDWDHKLTLEFDGVNPSFRDLAIRPLDRVTTVYLAGDSTVVDQDKEPWAAWGQILPCFFGPLVSIANEAESGETIRSFTSERRIDKIVSTIRPGDYLLIQFAHNDQKQGTPADTGFKDNLARYIELAQSHGATPILVTSMNRRNFNTDGTIKDTLGGYPQAMRETARERNVSLIDLNALSKTLFEAMGPEGTLKAFVHYPANTFPGQEAELKDDTHFNSYGAYELARALVQAIEDQKLPLAAYLRTDIPPFSPSHPDDPAAFNLPQSPMVSLDTPYGK